NTNAVHAESGRVRRSIRDMVAPVRIEVVWRTPRLRQRRGLVNASPELARDSGHRHGSVRSPTVRGTFAWTQPRANVRLTTPPKLSPFLQLRLHRAGPVLALALVLLAPMATTAENEPPNPRDDAAAEPGAGPSGDTYFSSGERVGTWTVTSVVTHSEFRRYTFTGDDGAVVG